MVEEWNKRRRCWENTQDQRNLGDFKQEKGDEKADNDWSLEMENVKLPLGDVFGVNDLNWVIGFLCEELDRAKKENPEITAESNTFRFKDKKGQDKYLLIKVADSEEDIYK